MRVTTLLPVVVSTAVLIQGAPVPNTTVSSSFSNSTDHQALSVESSIISFTPSALTKNETVKSETNSTSKDDEMKVDERTLDHPSFSIMRRAPTSIIINSTVHNISQTPVSTTRMMEELAALPLVFYLIAILPCWLMICLRMADWAICYRHHSEYRLRKALDQDTTRATEPLDGEAGSSSRFNLTIALAIPFAWPLIIWHILTSCILYEEALQAEDEREIEQRPLWLEEHQQRKGEREALLGKQRRFDHRLRMVSRGTGDAAGWNGPILLTNHDTDSSDDDEIHGRYAFGVGMMRGRVPGGYTPDDVLNDEHSDSSSCGGAESTRGTRSSSVSPLTI